MWYCLLPEKCVGLDTEILIWSGFLCQKQKNTDGYLWMRPRGEPFDFWLLKERWGAGVNNFFPTDQQGRFFQSKSSAIIVFGDNLLQDIFAAAASEPEANERGSSLISRRLHYRGLQSLFLTKRKELWLCASGRFRMRSGMPQGIVVMREWEDLGCSAYQSHV